MKAARSRSCIDVKTEGLIACLQIRVASVAPSMGCMAVHGAGPDPKKHPTDRLIRTKAFLIQLMWEHRGVRG